MNDKAKLKLVVNDHIVTVQYSKNAAAEFENIHGVKFLEEVKHLLASDPDLQKAKVA